MPSLRSRFFVFLLRHRHLLRFKLKRRNNIDRDTPVQQLRDEVERSAGFFGKLPEGFTVTPVSIHGISAEWLMPPDTPKEKAILYFHGGGLVIGSAKAHRGIVAKFVKGSGVGALVFDYGLAPEHPFPDGLNDSVSAYQYMLDEGIKPENIVFMGDSGGGNLCFATLLALKEQNIPLPAGAVTLSAWTDLKNTGESFITNAESDNLCWRDAQEIFRAYYCGDNDPGMPQISPLYGDLHGLPPLLLYAGSDELLRDDTTRLAARARDAGVDVTLHVGEGMFHCYPACAPLFPEATEAMNEICEFVRRRLNEIPYPVPNSPLNPLSNL
ncbi:MAG: alpha/beta hydrolase [Candidatus Latescibacteria bacterium]|nr:alpha/beta hydrolase [Candidatus Latescibacterota bacterium]